MPLTIEEQLKLNQLKQGLVGVESLIAKDLPGRMQSLNKLDTRGQPPNFDGFTDEDLRNIFDEMSKTFVNPIPYNHPNPQVRRFSQDALTQQSIDSGTLSRGELESFTAEFLKGHNNFLDPFELRNFQGGALLILDRDAPSKLKQLKEAYQQIKSDVEKRDGVGTYKDETFENDLPNVQQALKTRALELANLSQAYSEEAPRLSIETLQQRKLDVDGVAQLVYQSLPNPERGVKADLRGVNLSGIDVSKCDFTCAILDVPTLAKSIGAENAKGIDPEVRAGLLKLRGMEQERAQMEKKLVQLNKPFSFERFKAVFSGGASKVEKKLLEKLDKANRDIVSLADPKQAKMLRRNEHDQQLKEVMKSPSLGESFTKFAKEHNKGNEMDFLKEVEALRRDAREGVDLGELKVHAYGIQQRYLTPQSDKKFEVDYDARDRVSSQIDGEAFDHLDHEKIETLFNEIEGQVKSELADNTLQQFQAQQPKQSKGDHVSVRDRLGPKTNANNKVSAPSHHHKK